MDANKRYQEVENFLELLFQQDNIIEVRRIPSGVSDWGTPKEILEHLDHYTQANSKGENIYFGALPRNERGGKKDIDVAGGWCCWVDFDHTTPEAAKLAIIAAKLPDPTLLINSGNGVHAYCVFTMWQDAQSIRTLNGDLAAVLKSDAKVKNPSRIMRLPCFDNVKDPANPKPCYIVEVGAKVDFDALRNAVPRSEQRSKNYAGIAPDGAEEITESTRNSTLLSLAGSMRRRGMTEPEIVAALLVVNEQRCKPPLNEEEVWRIAASAAKYSPTLKADALSEEDYPLDDIGNGKRLAHLCAEDIRYCHDQGKWIVFDKKHWTSEHGAIERKAWKVVQTFRKLSRTGKNKEARDRYYRHWKLSSKGPSLREMIKQASFASEILIDSNNLDADKYLFNVKSGTVDLRTGELRPHRREDFLTHLTEVEYKKDAECPIWKEFLSQVMEGKQELLDFLQRAAGYCLTGDTSERVIFIMFGSGANGKSTFINTLSTLMGTYATCTRIETLLSRQSAGIPNDIARLRGKRFVTASEVEHGRSFNESLIKEITGGESLSARHLYQEFFTFVPEFKVSISTNYKPKIRNTDNAIWDRIRLIKFNKTIPEDQRDPKLQEKLKIELPGILNWAIKGCLIWQKEGLGYPPEIRDATNAYRAENDIVQNFINMCCVVKAEYEVPKGKFYETFMEWYGEYGDSEYPISKNEFGYRMQQLGYQEKKSGPTRSWRGIKLRPDYHLTLKGHKGHE